MLFLIFLIFGLGAMWFGAKPWIVTIASGGRKTMPWHVAEIMAIIIGVVSLDYAAENAGVLYGLFESVVNLALVVGIPAAIFMSRRAVKGAARERQREAIDAQRAEAAREEKRLAAERAAGPVVDLARAQGVLALRGHGSALAAGAAVRLPASTCYTGLVVIAPTESGKTACVAQPVAGHWLADRRAGLFAPGIKRSWAERLIEIALSSGRSMQQIHRIGPGHDAWPLIRGLEPDAISKFFEDALGSGKTGDPYWALAASNVIRRVAGILYHSTSDGRNLVADVEAENGEIIKSYTLSYDLRSIATVAYARDEALKAIIRAARAKAEMLRPVDKRAAESIDLSIESHERVMESIPEKQWGSVVSMLDAVIDPFISNYDLSKAFASDSDFDIRCLDRGEVVILDVDLSKFGATARLIYLLAREQLKRLMLERELRAESGSGADVNAVLYLQDEYASYAGRNDTELLRLCRAAKIAPVMLYQLQSDLEREVGKEAATAIYGAATNKLIFRTDDYPTIDLVMKALGQTDIEFETYSKQRGENSGSSSGTTNHGVHGGSNSGWSSGSSSSESWSYSVQQRHVVDQQLIHSLQKHLGKHIPRAQAYAECIFVGEIGTSRVADVVRVHPWSPPQVAIPTTTTIPTTNDGEGAGGVDFDALLRENS